MPDVPVCENCGASVPGKYCGACGQRLESPVHSLGHFLGTAFEDMTHADSRLWHTLLALLFKPGYLTREFLHGRRVSYLPPVRLYLVLSVVFFLWAGMTQTTRIMNAGPAKAAAAAAQTAPATGPAKPGARPADEETVQIVAFGAAKPGESPQQRAQRLCTMGSMGNGRIKDLLMHACQRSTLDDGRSLQEAFLHNVPRAMFLFLPLLAAAMMLLYWHPRRYYVEHLLLLLHNHAFVFLLVPIVGLLGWLVPPIGGALVTATWLYIAWYAWRSMRVVYGQGSGRTLLKLAAVGFFYFFAGVIMVVITSLYSFLTA